MSLKFKEPMNDAAREMIAKEFGEHQLQDDHITLFGRSIMTTHKVLGYVANVAGQPITLCMHEEGDVVTMDDGKSYRCTEGLGWVAHDMDTWECDWCEEDRPMDHEQIIIGMRQYCSQDCSEKGE